MVFENPVWDAGLSFRAALPHVAAMLAGRGRDDAASTALTAIEHELSAQQLRTAYRSALDSLDEDREMFFVPSEQTRARLQQARQARPCEGPDGAKFDDDSSERHHQAISADQAAYDSLLPLLARLPAAALLITGGMDPITGAEQRHAFQQASPHNRMREFPRAGHCVHADEPDAYANAVTEFIRAQWR